MAFMKNEIETAIVSFTKKYKEERRKVSADRTGLRRFRTEKERQEATSDVENLFYSIMMLRACVNLYDHNGSALVSAISEVDVEDLKK